MRIIYVDDEPMAITRFELLAGGMSEVTDLKTFRNPLYALHFAKENDVDVAFLDVEMRQMNGLELASQLTAVNKNTKIVFITAYSEYALPAYGIDALGYLLKPYTREKIKNELIKAGRMRDVRRKQVYIQTMPRFDVFVQGQPFPIPSPKLKEFLALMVDRNGGFVTSDYAATYLWENKPNDEKTKSLYRVTAHRLHRFLSDNGVSHILNYRWSQKAVDPNQFDCDYYQLLSGDENAICRYSGQYMVEYSWAEETNAKIIRMLERRKRLASPQGL